MAVVSAGRVDCARTAAGEISRASARTTRTDAATLAGTAKNLPRPVGFARWRRPLSPLTVDADPLSGNAENREKACGVACSRPFRRVVEAGILGHNVS